MLYFPLTFSLTLVTYNILHYTTSLIYLSQQTISSKRFMHLQSILSFFLPSLPSYFIPSKSYILTWHISHPRTKNPFKMSFQKSENGSQLCSVNLLKIVPFLSAHSHRSQEKRWCLTSMSLTPSRSGRWSWFGGGGNSQSGLRVKGNCARTLSSHLIWTQPGERRKEEGRYHRSTTSTLEHRTSSHRWST